MMGIDPSLKMLEKAKRKNPNIDWKVGTVENIELPDNHVEGILVNLTIHHWSDLQKGLGFNGYKTIRPAGYFYGNSRTNPRLSVEHYFPQHGMHSMLQWPDLARPLTQQ